MNAFFVLSVIALFATTNTVLLMLLAASRIIYGMADSSSLPEVLGRVHPVTRTPWMAVLASMILCMGFVLLGDIALVANVNNFTVFVTFITINAALMLLRYRKPEISRPFKVPLAIGKVPVAALPWRDPEYLHADPAYSRGYGHRYRAYRGWHPGGIGH